MPAAVAIPLITGAVSGATSLIGAKVASNAAKNAAKTQTASADKAIALQNQLYQDQQQRMSPFVNAGGQALGQLGQMSSQRAPMFDPSQRGGGFTLQMSQPMGGQGMLGKVGMPTVKMRAPDGSVRDVPQDQVPMFQQKGAQVIG